MKKQLYAAWLKNYFVLFCRWDGLKLHLGSQPILMVYVEWQNHYKWDQIQLKKLAIHNLSSQSWSVNNGEVRISVAIFIQYIVSSHTCKMRYRKILKQRWKKHFSYVRVVCPVVTHTIKRSISKRVVAQRHVKGYSLIFLAEDPLSEDFSKEQSPVVISSHIVIYLPIDRQVR